MVTQAAESERRKDISLWNVSNIYNAVREIISLVLFHFQNPFPEALYLFWV